MQQFHHVCTIRHIQRLRSCSRFVCPWNATERRRRRRLSGSRQLLVEVALPAAEGVKVRRKKYDEEKEDEEEIECRVLQG